MAKTTTVLTLGAALAERGIRVLLVDLDPQACLTFSTGIDPEDLDRSLHDVLVNRQPASEILLKVRDVHLLPASIDLAGAEVHLLSRPGREYVLARAIEPLKVDYDVVLIDCPPSLGILTVNGLTAADQVLVPLQCETLSQRGVVATMFDSRTRLGREVLAGMNDRYGLEVLEPPVPKSVRVAEAPGRGCSVLDHAPDSGAADAYRRLASVLVPA